MSKDSKANAAKSKSGPAAKGGEAQPNAPPAMKKNGVAQPNSARVVKILSHGGPLLSARFDPTGKYVFASGQDYRISRFSLADGKRVSLPDEHESWVRGMAFAPDGETLLTAGYDGRLIWWSATATTPEPIRQVDAHDGWIREVAVSPDGKLIATCGNDMLVKLWEMSTGKLIQQLTGHDRHVYNVKFHPSGSALVSNDLMGNFRHWNVSSGKLEREFRQAQMHKYDPKFRADIGGARGMAFSPDGTLLAASGITDVSNAFAGVGKPTVELIDWATGKRLRRYVHSGKGIAWGVALHEDHFVVAAYAGVLLFWTYTDAKLFHQANVGSLAFDLSLHADGLRVATAHHDGKVRISRLAAAPSNS